MRQAFHVFTPAKLCASLSTGNRLDLRNTSVQSLRYLRYSPSPVQVPACMPKLLQLVTNSVLLCNLCSKRAVFEGPDSRTLQAYPS